MICRHRRAIASVFRSAVSALLPLAIGCFVTASISFIKQLGSGWRSRC